MTRIFERLVHFAAQSLVLGLVFAIPLLAQVPTTAVWRGYLRNSASAPVMNAKVRLTGASTAEASTAPDGAFTLPALPPGKYKLTVEAEGWKVAYAQTIELTPAAPVELITMSNRGEMEVSEQQQTGATGGVALSSQAVSELPLNKRDFSSLLLLAAGTMTDTNGATNFTAQFAINGQRGVEATFAMDGADISDPEMGGATLSNFNVDAVEGIDSSSGWMPADIGRGAAGFTNIHTRSGASGFHGSFFEFVRNSAFDARNFFDHPTPAYPGRIPPFRRNEFGFTNGGPVYIPHLYDGRKRTFYFAEYQGFRQVLGTTQVMPVPTATQRPSGGPNIVSDTVSLPDGTTDSLAIPVNPSIAAILARYPLPNLPTGSFGANTYATASKVTTNADQFSLRIDHKLSAKNQFFARFTMDNLTGPTTNPDQTAIDPAFAVEYLDRQRNVVGTLTTTFTPKLVLESSLSITRSTPGFPTPDSTDPAVKFEDGLFEAFNSAGGSVMQAYGNLFQEQENISYNAGQHTLKAGFEVRKNVDTTYFGIPPNGEYDFGGGTAYATEAIASASGKHNINVGDPLPDTLSGLLSGSPFAYIVAVAPPGVSDGAHIGPAAINRSDYNAYVEDTWKVTPMLTLDYGVRWEYYTPITERAHRTGSFRTLNGTLDYVVNPQPGYSTTWNGWGPRVQISWAPLKNFTAHAGGAVTVIPPNIWQDNMLTGSTPFSISPRRQSSSSAPLAYGFSITPSMLPIAYDLSGNGILAKGAKNIPANTPMDVDRYEKDLANVTSSGAVSSLNLSGIDAKFGNGALYTWTLGLERKIANLTADLGYVGTVAQKLPRISFPNAYPGATPGFAPYTQFNSAGAVTGGFGVMNVMTNDVHSNYNALQASLSGTVGNGGPGIQASYTWGKSIDTTSVVLSGTGSTGATTSGTTQDPFNLRAEKGPSSFDVSHSFGLSVAQDLHLQNANFLSAVPRKITYGWELLSISSISSGAPFTVYSGLQQTGAGANGVDRPDQIARPKLSTARTNRQDYFGMGDANAGTYFRIPIHIAAGTGPNQGRFGTLGRDTFRGPAYYDYDFAVIKDTPFGRRSSGAERMDLQFRGEFFNLFNIVNMGLPANILTGSGFGEISKTAGTSRQIQLSLKVIY
jgi:Carboxypeptidase regulatory-like domain/TonB dependent receptor